MTVATLTNITAMNRLLVHQDGETLEFMVANGFVSRVVSSIAEDNHFDARIAAKILNAYFAAGGSYDLNGNLTQKAI